VVLSISEKRATRSRLQKAFRFNAPIPGGACACASFWGVAHYYGYDDEHNRTHNWIPFASIIGPGGREQGRGSGVPRQKVVQSEKLLDTKYLKICDSHLRRRWRAFMSLSSRPMPEPTETNPRLETPVP
jgi:hypothetical protein